jgi:hypothetical protein
VMLFDGIYWEADGIFGWQLSQQFQRRTASERNLISAGGFQLVQAIRPSLHHFFRSARCEVRL